LGVQHGQVTLHLLALRQVVGARDISQKVQILEAPQVRFEFVALLGHIYVDRALIAHEGVEALLVIVMDREGPEKHADLFLQDGQRHTMRRAGATLAYARPLLAEDEDAEAHYLAGLGDDLANWPFLRGRLQLEYGGWLRRRRRAADSRPPLRAAVEVFDALGALPWAERARVELRASGEVRRARTVDARDQLSPQELQIAQLAAEGLSNHEIGERLYLSHRTVGSHLYRLFPKLGITSRAEGYAALAGEPLSP
jgi:DNA-binding CsgD family transcriptional regulator